MKKKIGIIIAGCIVVLAVIGCAVWYFAAGNKNTEEPKNAQNVSNMVDEKNIPVETEGETANEVTEAPKSGEDTVGQDAGSAESKGTQKAEKVKPTFMYFVTNTDMKSETTQKVITDLKKEYEDRVVFDIKNVDDDPELLENFALVKDQTPALIMLNTNNDICKFLFKTTDLDDLKASIEEALKV